MYFNLHFGLPQGCKIRGATITLSLDEEDPCLKLYASSLQQRILHRSGAAVQFTEWYGPQNLGGEKKSAFVTSKTTIAPEANLLGCGVGGITHERSKLFEKEARWSFNGRLLRGKRAATYTSLRWNLVENDVNSQPFHAPKFRTAFAFQHSGQPFLIKVAIEGRLKKWHHQVQCKLKFGMDGAKEGKVVTLVDFEDHRKFSNGLDGIARGLPRAMELENLEEIPMEIPDVIPGTSFQQLSPSDPVRSALPAMPQNVAPKNASYPQQVLSPREAHTVLDDVDLPQSADGKITLGRRGEQTLPSAEDYRRVLLALSRPDPHILPEDSLGASSRSVTPLIGAEDATEWSSKNHNHTGVEAQVTAAEKTRSLDELFRSRTDRDTMARILSLPGMIVLLQLLFKLMGIFGTNLLGRTPKTNGGGARESDTIGTQAPKNSKEQIRWVHEMFPVVVLGVSDLDLKKDQPQRAGSEQSFKASIDDDSLPSLLTLPLKIGHVSVL